MTGQSQSKFLEVIGEGISRTTYILDVLNKFQKKKDNKYEKCDLKKILQDCIHDLKDDLAEDKKITFSNNGKEAVLVGNPHDLKQLFRELLKNSIQSIDSVGEISIETRSNGSSCMVSIKDDGIGIDKENLTLLENLFLPPKIQTKEKDLGYI